MEPAVKSVARTIDAAKKYVGVGFRSGAVAMGSEMKTSSALPRG
jgi:hypothetical protein